MSLYRPQAVPRYSPVGSKAPVNPKSSIAVRYVPPWVTALDGDALVPPPPVVADGVAPPPPPPPQAAATSPSTHVIASAPMSFRFVTFPPFWESLSIQVVLDRSNARFGPSFPCPLSYRP